MDSARPPSRNWFDSFPVKRFLAALFSGIFPGAGQAYWNQKETAWIYSALFILVFISARVLTVLTVPESHVLFHVWLAAVWLSARAVIPLRIFSALQAFIHIEASRSEDSFTRLRHAALFLIINAVIYQLVHYAVIYGVAGRANRVPVIHHDVPASTRLLQDRDTAYRRAAIHHLMRDGASAQRAVPELIEHLNEIKDDNERYETLLSLIAIAPQDKDVRAALIARLADGDARIRDASREALCRQGTAIREPLHQAMAQPALRRAALTLLSESGPPDAIVWKALEEGRADSDPKVHDIAARAWEALRRDPSVLHKQLDQSDYRIRAQAARWIGIRLLTGESSHLLAHLADSDGDVRDAVATALVRMKDVDGLTNALHNSNALVRATAAQALGKIGYDARSALDTLATLAKDPDSDVRAAAEGAITAIQHPNLPV